MLTAWEYSRLLSDRLYAVYAVVLLSMGLTRGDGDDGFAVADD